MHFQPTHITGPLTLSALALAMHTAWAADSGHPGVGKSDMAYEGAPIATKPGEAQDMITTEGPPMTKDEFDLAKRIFFQRCAGAMASCARARRASP